MLVKGYPAHQCLGFLAAGCIQSRLRSSSSKSWSSVVNNDNCVRFTGLGGRLGGLDLWVATAPTGLDKFLFIFLKMSAALFTFLVSDLVIAGEELSEKSDMVLGESVPPEICELKLGDLFMLRSFCSLLGGLCWLLVVKELIEESLWGDLFLERRSGVALLKFRGGTLGFICDAELAPSLPTDLLWLEETSLPWLLAGDQSVKDSSPVVKTLLESDLKLGFTLSVTFPLVVDFPLGIDFTLDFPCFGDSTKANIFSFDSVFCDTRAEVPGEGVLGEGWSGGLLFELFPFLLGLWFSSTSGVLMFVLIVSSSVLFFFIRSALSSRPTTSVTTQFVSSGLFPGLLLLNLPKKHFTWVFSRGVSTSFSSPISSRKSELPDFFIFLFFLFPFVFFSLSFTSSLETSWISLSSVSLSWRDWFSLCSRSDVAFLSVNLSRRLLMVLLMGVLDNGPLSDDGTICLLGFSFSWGDVCFLDLFAKWSDVLAVVMWPLPLFTGERKNSLVPELSLSNTDNDTSLALNVALWGSAVVIATGDLITWSGDDDLWPSSLGLEFLSRLLAALLTIFFLGDNCSSTGFCSSSFDDLSSPPPDVSGGGCEPGLPEFPALLAASLIRSNSSSSKSCRPRCDRITSAGKETKKLMKKNYESITDAWSIYQSPKSHNAPPPYPATHLS